MTVFVARITKLELLGQYKNFGKLLFFTVRLTVLKDFPDEIVGDNNECGF